MRRGFIISGAAGRMGQEIVHLLETRRAEIIATIDHRGRGTHESIRELQIVGGGKGCVLIDFSSPTGLLECLKWCEKHRVPIVSGTTGISDRHHRALKAAAKKVPVLWSPNMSRGVNIMNEIIREFGHILGDFDVQVEEAHHKRKKDRPSGTARLLQTSLCDATGRKVPAPISIRGGGIFGIHKLWAMSESEVLTIEHTALNRKVFAEGAIEAAVWLSNKRPALYAYRDLLK